MDHACPSLLCLLASLRLEIWDGAVGFVQNHRKSMGPNGCMPPSRTSNSLVSSVGTCESTKCVHNSHLLCWPQKAPCWWRQSCKKIDYIAVKVRTWCRIVPSIRRSAGAWYPRDLTPTRDQPNLAVRKCNRVSTTGVFCFGLTHPATNELVRNKSLVRRVSL